MTDEATALGRVLRKAGGPRILDVLAGRLSGADLITLLLEVTRVRARRLSPADVLRRYTADRFSAPAAIPLGRLRRAEDAVLSALPPEFEQVLLSPVAPLGACSAVAAVDQNKVVATVRNTEVAADPTNGLALEAAVRRRAGQAAVRLATVQRVVRAQRFEGAGMSPHFTLFAMVTAGAGRGLSFEREHAAEHFGVLADAVRACGLPAPEIRVTALDERHRAVVDEVVADRMADAEGRSYTVALDPGRESGRGYYAGFCFKVYAGGVEVGDGGFVDWTARLLGNRRERLLISALGVDRLS